MIPGLTQTVNAGRTIHQGKSLVSIFTSLKGFCAIGHQQPRIQPPVRQEGINQGKCSSIASSFGRSDFGTIFVSSMIRAMEIIVAGILPFYYRAQVLYEHPCGFYMGPNVEWVPFVLQCLFWGYGFADPYAVWDSRLAIGRKEGWRSSSRPGTSPIPTTPRQRA